MNYPARFRPSGINELLAFITFSTLQVGLSEQALTSHDMQNEHSFLLMSVEDSAWRFNDLAVARLFKFGGNRAQERVGLKFVNMGKNTPNKRSSSGWILYCDVVRNGFEVR